MMRFVNQVVQQAEADAYGFPRHQCAVSIDGRLLRHLDHNATTEHRQWRLYRPAQARFTKRIHASGIEINDLRCVAAPDWACMIHLDWAVHNYEQRKAKIRRYDVHTPGAGSDFRPYFLFEDFPSARERFQPLELPEFRSVARSIHERFQDLCVDDRNFRNTTGIGQGDLMRVLSNEQIIIALYTSILGRYPDAGGFDNYNTRLTAGATLEELIMEFIGSEEFRTKYLERKFLA